MLAPSPLRVTRAGRWMTDRKQGETVTYTVMRARTVPAEKDGDPAACVVNGEPATITVTRSADTFPPAPPTGLVAVRCSLRANRAASTCRGSRMPSRTWRATSCIAATARVRPRATDPAPFAPSALAMRPSQAGHTYTYVLRAVDAAGNRSARAAPRRRNRVRP